MLFNVSTCLLSVDRKSFTLLYACSLRDHRGPILFKELVPISVLALETEVYIANYIYRGNNFVLYFQ